MNIQNILVPVDFSTCSLLVTQQAAALAAKLGAKVTLLHVGEMPRGMTPTTVLEGGKTAEAVLRADAEALLGRFVDTIRVNGVAHTVDIRFGAVVPTILTAIEDTHAHLVVIGTHGRTGLARVMLGSIAEGVAHKAHVPVMLVRRETRPECARASCEWCPHDGRSAKEQQLEAESQG